MHGFFRVIRIQDLNLLWVLRPRASRVNFNLISVPEGAFGVVSARLAWQLQESHLRGLRSRCLSRDDDNGEDWRGPDKASLG